MILSIAYGTKIVHGQEEGKDKSAGTFRERLVDTDVLGTVNTKDRFLKNNNIIDLLAL